MKDAIAFTTMQMKHYYNKAHITRFFEVNKMVNLQLHCGYTILSIQNKKLDQQFVNPLCVLKCVKKLAY